MARTKPASKKVQNTAEDTREMPIEDDELEAHFLQEITALYDGFLPEFTLNQPLKPYVCQPEDGRNLRSETLGQYSWLDGELVYLGLRRLVETVLKDSEVPVSVLPTLDPTLLTSSIETFVTSKINFNREKYEDLVLLREIADTKEELQEIVAQNEARSRKIASKRQKIILENKITPDRLISIYLQAMFKKLNFNLDAEQHFILPIRENNSHFTVLNIRIANNNVSIEYRDSMGGYCLSNIRTAVLACFNALKNDQTTVTFEQMVSFYQTNGYDCGLFTILNGLNTASAHAGKPAIFKHDLDNRRSLLYRMFLFVLYRSLGANIDLEPAFARQLKGYIENHPEFLIDVQDTSLEAIVLETHFPQGSEGFKFKDVHRNYLLFKIQEYLQNHPIYKSLEVSAVEANPGSTPESKVNQPPLQQAVENSFWDFLKVVEPADYLLMLGGGAFVSAALYITGLWMVAAAIAMIPAGFWLFNTSYDWIFGNERDLDSILGLTTVSSDSRLNDLQPAGRTFTSKFDSQKNESPGEASTQLATDTKGIQERLGNKAQLR